MTGFCIKLNTGLKTSILVGVKYTNGALNQ